MGFKSYLDGHYDAERLIIQLESLLKIDKNNNALFLEDDINEVPSFDLVIIDEVDELLKDNFTEQFCPIMEAVNQKAQICTLSATMPKSIHEIITKFSRDPVNILVKKEQLTLSGIKQYYVNAEEDKYNRFSRGLPPKSKGDWAFILHMIESAYEDTGMVGVVVPHGVLFRGNAEGRIRRHVIEDNLLDAVIGLPANLFFGTGIPAAILIFNKGKDKRTNTLFIDASEEYESSKNQNVLTEVHLNHIVDTYVRFRESKLTTGVIEDKYSYVATREEMEENEYNLNIPRYVDTFEEEAAVDITQVQSEIHQLEHDLKGVQAKMKEYLKELNL
jgi:hypothetical protein